jgi:hypothetical protein
MSGGGSRATVAIFGAHSTERALDMIPRFPLDFPHSPLREESLCKHSQRRRVPETAQITIGSRRLRFACGANGSNRSPEVKLLTSRQARPVIRAMTCTDSSGPGVDLIDIEVALRSELQPTSEGGFT